MNQPNKTGHKRICLICWMLIACLLIGAYGMLVPAAAPQTGQLSLICRSEQVTLSNMKWNIYRVAQRDAKAACSLTAPFDQYPVSLEDQTASGYQDAADTLENYAVLDQIPAVASGITDANGVLTASGLEIGLYLISGSPIVIGSECYIPSATLVEMRQQTDGTIDLATYPKFTVRPVRADSEEVYTLKKVWQQDEQALEQRPTAITVGIYKDGTLQENVTLDESNAWTYTWAGNSSETFRVREQEVPTPYTVVYKKNETQFLIANTRSETSSEETTTTLLTGSTSMTTAAGTSSVSTAGGGNTGKLPQTGQLWWPVPVLGTTGLLLFAFGCRLHVKRSREEVQDE